GRTKGSIMKSAKYPIAFLFFVIPSALWAGTAPAFQSDIQSLTAEVDGRILEIESENALFHMRRNVKRLASDHIEVTRSFETLDKKPAVVEILNYEKGLLKKLSF